MKSSLESCRLRVLVTGASGFIGGRLIEHLGQLGVDCIGTSRSKYHAQNFRQFDLVKDTDHMSLVRGVDCVVHCAAAVHGSTRDDSEFHQINVDATLKLARACLQTPSIKRFIFLSTVKVNGEVTYGEAFTPDDEPRPVASYAKSKRLAEEGLKRMFRGTSVKFVIIRLPLVHGRGVKGNLAKLDKLLRYKFPLPIQNLDKNRRSIVSIENLLDFITNCMRHDNAVDQTFFVKDENDLSTYEIFALMARNNDLKLKTFALPSAVIKLFFFLAGKNSAIEKLFGSLQIDCSKNYELLGWVPGETKKPTPDTNTRKG